MIEFLFTAIIMLLAIGGLAIGVLAGRGPIKGGCGRSEAACDGHCARRCEQQREGDQG